MSTIQGHLRTRPECTHKPWLRWAYRLKLEFLTKQNLLNKQVSCNGWCTCTHEIIRLRKICMCVFTHTHTHTSHTHINTHTHTTHTHIHTSTHTNTHNTHTHITWNTRATVSITVKTNMPPSPIIISVRRPSLSIKMADTNVMPTLTTPVPAVAYWATAWERPASSNTNVE